MKRNSQENYKLLFKMLLFIGLLIVRLSYVNDVKADGGMPDTDDDFLPAFMKALEEEMNNPSSSSFDNDFFTPPGGGAPPPIKETVTIIEGSTTNDPRELFINPPLKKVKVGTKETVEPTPAAFAACRTVCDQLIATMSEIEKKSTSTSSSFSPVFKDEFVACQTVIDRLETILKNIASDTGERVYMRALLAPAEAQKEVRKKLRTKMIDALKKADKLNKKIPSQIINEERESGDELLRLLGKKSYVPQAKVKKS